MFCSIHNWCYQQSVNTDVTYLPKQDKLLANLACQN
jgi:hypothetical protein